MLLAIFGFLSLSLIDILDIILVALIIFVVFRWIRGTSAMSIFMAILSLYVNIIKGLKKSIPERNHHLINANEQAIETGMDKVKILNKI